MSEGTAPTPDYFSLFDLPVSFALDSPALEKAYFAAQRQFHPDRLIGKNSGERRRAIGRSMLVNEGYETLKSPLKRAKHLLALAGCPENSLKAAPEQLMEIMELREEVAQADAALAQALAARNETAKSATLNALLKAFEKSDIIGAAHLTMRLGYLVKLDDDIRVRKKAMEVI